MSLILPTAYAPPIVYMALLYIYEGKSIQLEACEHIIKQSWRNRCDILAAQGVQSLTVPIERPHGWRTMIKDVRISEHGAWRHQHEQALHSSYGNSPYFEYYWDDIKGFYKQRYTFLWDYNLELLSTLCRLIHLDFRPQETEDFLPPEEMVGFDWRYRLHPRALDRSKLVDYPPYYQTLAKQENFVAELSVYDLLMNMGPESLLYLRDYAQKIEQIKPFGGNE